MKVSDCKSIRCKHLHREYNEDCQNFSGKFICGLRKNKWITEIKSCQTYDNETASASR